MYGALGLSRYFGKSTTFISLTVVALATSAPELATSFIAAHTGNSELALGNLSGSNLANLGLILGFCVFLRPLALQKSVLVLEFPVVLGAMIALALMTAGLTPFETGILEPWEGLLLLLAFFAYTSRFLYAQSSFSLPPAPSPPTIRFFFLYAVCIFLASFLLFAGSKILVCATLELADRWLINSALLGLTIVAIGTSLPEISTTFSAFRRKEDELIIGNLVGSNIINTLFITGGISCFYPLVSTPSLNITFLIAALSLLPAVLILLINQHTSIPRFLGAWMFLAYWISIFLAYFFS